MLSKREKYKPWLIVASGFLTLLLMNLFPVDGGGVSLIFVISVPFFIGLSIIFALIYRWRSKKIHARWIRNLLFTASIAIITLLSFYSFPCSDDDAPCPLKVVSISSKVLFNQDNIVYNDLFVEKTKTNYPLIIVARKKFKDRLPEKTYYITYDSLKSYHTLKHYAIYLINDSIKSDNENLLIEHLSDGEVRFTEIYQNDTLSFKGTTDGFADQAEYYNYHDNGYGYKSWYREFPNISMEIRKEVENDIYKYHLFYKILFWIA